MNDKEKTLQILGATIKKLREEHEMSLEDLASKAGYTSDNRRSSMQKIEAGKSDVPASKLLPIALALDTTPGVLMGMVERQVEQIEACELFAKCYGKESFDAVQMFLRLDNNDRKVVVTMMQSLLSTEKYEEIKVSKGDMDTIASAI